ncbi:hypothetical protein CAPTEDRAFT_188994 [Capitella teleta]|uniref:Potassium channel domain-containing protein n=1 Tax=Capitella teleta TaxID=283909 RepID=R7UUQ8_CAPTE|nr:hypothetical protein CAPTEDRAFT_188994 [Capitella teleta]|eukprot:ELU07101.1 hypothetical protein CAPTEDRAFT_188994 [Capitella teleta]
MAMWLRDYDVTAFVVLLWVPCICAVDMNIIWWTNPPYFFSTQPGNISWDDGLDGVFKVSLGTLFARCNRTAFLQDAHLIQTSNALTMVDVYRNMTNPPSTLLFVGVSRHFKHHAPTLLKEALLPSSAFIQGLQTPGAVHFYRRADQPVGSDLLTVIVQGWPLLILILLGAGYSGIIIWLLDRLWNPANFPKPFIRGFWEGFWWAFVTMTTVG